MFRRANPVERAQRLFDQGAVEAAAWLLWQERSRAIEMKDNDWLAEIDEAGAGMLARLEGDFRRPSFEAHLQGREPRAPAEDDTDRAFPTAETEEVVDVTPLSLGIALLGAGLMLIAVFLPQFESNTFARIEQNTLIQSGNGWWFISLAVVGAGAAYRSYRQQRRGFAAVVLGGIGIGIALYDGLSHSQRRLCSVIAGSSDCTLGTPGIGIYAAGIGAGLLLIGGWQIFRSQRLEAEAGEEDDEDEADAEAASAPIVAAATIAERLRTLEQLRADALITDAEYAQRRAALIEQV